MEGITRTCFANEVGKDCLRCAEKHVVLIVWRLDVAAPIKFFVSSMLVCTMNTSIFSIFFLITCFFLVV